MVNPPSLRAAHCGAKLFYGMRRMDDVALFVISDEDLCIVLSCSWPGWRAGIDYTIYSLRLISASNILTDPQINFRLLLNLLCLFTEYIFVLMMLSNSPPSRQRTPRESYPEITYPFHALLHWNAASACAWPPEPSSQHGRLFPD